jgi:hypothetical protein
MGQEVNCFLELFLASLQDIYRAVVLPVFFI